MSIRSIILLICLPTFLNAQEQLGLRLENYAGVSSLAINPAGNLSNPLKWDINLAGAAAFWDNNYFFIEKFSSIELIKSIDGAEFFSRVDFPDATNLPDSYYAVDYFDDNKKRGGAVIAQIMGPSIAVKIGENHSVGIFTNYRAYGSAFGISANFSYYEYYDRQFLDEFSVAPFDAAILAWRELGLNYAFQMPTANGKLGLGVNVRFLQGLEVGYFINKKETGYSKAPGNVGLINQPDIAFGFTSSNLDYNDFQFESNGAGFATDIGVTYMIDANTDAPYLLKIGASFLDLGYLNFDRNSQAHIVQTNSVLAVDGDDYDQFVQPQELELTVATFSQNAYQDPNGSLQGREIQALLPAAFSLQGDYSFTPNVYLNALLIQRLPFDGVLPGRANLLALTPRFEHRWGSASLPIVLHNYQDVRIGLAFRFAFLVIGSDKIGSWLLKTDYTGTDIYTAIKINFSGEGLSLFGGGGKIGKSRRGRGKVKCYDF